MTNFTVDPERTSVWIDARSSLHAIKTESSGMTGHIEATLQPEGGLDLSVPVSARLEMPLSSMSSGNPLYDREMQRRTDARRYPKISADLKSLTSHGSDGRYTAAGDVTFRGVTREVSDVVTLSSPEPGVLVFEGEHVFSLPDFNMEPPKIMMLKVYPDVTVRVRIVASEAADA
ncbi:MAG TPA: YceI family protein [Acidimicrobiales bacterium]|nr:YceI family protein [Acidimicrobiales bacterium]